ncbi:transmembrane protein 209-like [Mytilus californianus]|uniref:transmembrane protein 209-like n=1 Tax=Mytilus californianus TaxID=6549 RepID=UPI0022478A6B|nr:transmembrane protein 209-like [Mytilus californianus]XP_052060940.1 transmembrane protein 209-like [Mytilus californianus]XP_052060998.1 transmembrane protein 209-like [Mytilus californianus]XP_052061054.1 transmembrane protein 209-like [Mytilus californianus]
MTKIGTVTDPVVNETWNKRQSWKQARKSSFWCCVNILLAIVMYTEMQLNSIGSSLNITHPVLWYFECILAVIFLLNSVTNFFVYLKPYISTKSVMMTPAQKKLLAVRDIDAGFSISPRKLNLSSEESLMLSSTPSAHSSFSSTASQRQTTPTNMSGPISFTNHSMIYSTYSSPAANISGVQNISSISPGTSFAHNSSISPNVSGFTHHPSFSPGNSFSPGMQNSFDSSGLRGRRSMSNSFKASPASTSFDRITDLHSLSQYLKEQDEREYKTALSSPDNTSAGASFWSYGRSAMDCTHLLKKYMYQMASRSPQSPTSRHYDSDQSSLYNGEDIWGKRRVTEDELYLWTERVRKWICLSVVSRVAKEIDQINATLRRIGSEETEIGEVSVSTLKHLAFTKGSLVPSLNTVVTYLDFSSNQEYLVKRIKDLGRDGCMSDFVWNNGGHYGKTWGEHLPNDASLVMHMLCTYFDTRLPAQPKYPDGKTFTSQYFIKTPDKPNLDKEDTFCIYQSAINPPHFQVVIGKSMHNLPKGRNNMFQAVLLFLHHIKTKEHGMLGRVNLGMSGVNVLWIFES